MLELRGKYNSAKIFTDNIEETAISQIIELCNQPFVETVYLTNSHYYILFGLIGLVGGTFSKS